ncbi:hypothetical protein [Mangrovicoccus sp. HB161399]|uniref:hypothetical protein n=1 Tax=Mangrovicoccus sp. HB161399 TaxID=2720392 RepID=UPI0015566C57|nr:hypothetical protein [Mangrovicoccus sp. HB161399]
MTTAPSRLPCLALLALLAACGTPEHLKTPVTAAPQPLPAPVDPSDPLSAYPALSSRDYGACAVVLLTGRALDDPDSFNARREEMQAAAVGMMSQAPDPAKANETAEAVSTADDSRFYAYVSANRDGCRDRYPAYARQIGA